MLAQFLSNAPKFPLGLHRWVTCDVKKIVPTLAIDYIKGFTNSFKTHMNLIFRLH
jgi:hypothetical protein